jgi:DNA-binding XRE family transcriptional regulator
MLPEDITAQGGGHFGGAAVETIDSTLDSGNCAHGVPIQQTCLQCIRKLDCAQAVQNLLLMKSLGEQAREYRETLGWDTAEMATKVGTSRQNIESLEKAGNRIPRYIGQLARVMKTPVDTLMQRAGLGGYQEGLFTEDTEGGYAVAVLANSGSMGRGSDTQEEVVVGRLTLSPSFLRKSLASIRDPSSLRFIHGAGDSMEPTFYDGDVMLVDTDVKEVKVDGVYVLSANQRIYIKRVRQRIDGIFEVSSDNSAVKTVDVLDGSTSVEILGKVAWLWNGKKI